MYHETDRNPTEPRKGARLGLLWSDGNLVGVDVLSARAEYSGLVTGCNAVHLQIESKWRSIITAPVISTFTTCSWETSAWYGMKGCIAP